jgi:hypothetical protein
MSVVFVFKLYSSSYVLVAVSASEGQKRSKKDLISVAAKLGGQ